MSFTEQDAYFITKAIEVSHKSIDTGGYPVGAIIVKDDQIVAEGLSNGKKNFDATMHAEIDAIRNASQKLQTRNLVGVTLYSSLEPCVMCFSASFWAYIPKIIYACNRQSVSKDYYMGEHDISELNKKNRRKIQILHFKQFSDAALKIIHGWEKSKK